MNQESVALVSQATGYKSPRRYIHRARFLFEGIHLQGKKVLDVGCGRGMFALWAGLAGATNVLGLEPEMDGSTTGTRATFEELVASVGLTGSIRVEDMLLSDLDAAAESYDVIILYNVINHLDEDAVQHMHRDRNSWDRFRAIAKHIYDLTAAGGEVIVADCGRTNLWNRLGISNPLAPSIEWAKHQDPDEWQRLFEHVGFTRRDIRWSPLYPIGSLTRTRFVQQSLISHFVLRMRRTD